MFPALEVKFLWTGMITGQQQRIRKILQMSNPVFQILLPDNSELLLFYRVKIVVIVPLHLQRTTAIGFIQPLQKNGRAHAIADNMVHIQQQIPPTIVTAPGSGAQQRCGL